MGKIAKNVTKTGQKTRQNINQKKGKKFFFR